EAGNAEEALAHAERVNPRALASENRRAALGMEKARAHAMLEHDAEAVSELSRAERLSPAQVRNSPLLRETVAELIRRAHREPRARELNGLAWRMGVVTAR